MATAPDALVRVLRQDLRRHADRAEARRLSRAVKGDLPFLGVAPQIVLRLVRERLADPSLQLTTPARWEAAVRGLWSGDATRESRYAAIVLTRHPRFRTFASTAAATSLYRDLIGDRPTRDTVDALATLSLVLPLRARPETEAPVLRSWAVVGSPWLRRAVILCQARRGRHVDSGLLKACIGANLRDRRPVVRDAIPEALAAYLRGLPGAGPCLRATLEAWSSQIPPALARAIDHRLGTHDPDAR